MHFSLAQNYPNPFNPSTTIAFEVSTQSRVTITVYDVLGREVRTLFAGEKVPGRYELNFDAAQIASGPYYCRMVATSTGGVRVFEDTKKLVILK